MILYKQHEAWGLPSSSLPCIQVEAYLRLASVPFQVQICKTSSKSPSGQVPELEEEERIAGLEVTQEAAVPGARDVCSQFIKRHHRDLDLKLSVTQKAEALAYSALIQTRLEVAIMVSSWCEAPGFAEMLKASAQPFPLNYLIPWSQQRQMKSKYGHLDVAMVYSDAEAALTALADRLEAHEGPFFFGSEPSSLDALLVGVLLYLRHSPAAAPALQKKACEQPALREYVDHITREYFSEAAAAAPHPGEQAGRSSSWRSPSGAQPSKDEKSKPEPPAAEKHNFQASCLWLLGAGVATLAYVLLGGQYFKIDLRRGGIISAEDGEDEDEGESY